MSIVVSHSNLFVFVLLLCSVLFCFETFVRFLLSVFPLPTILIVDDVVAVVVVAILRYLVCLSKCDGKFSSHANLLNSFNEKL